jgi:hypothetical protein
MHIQFVNKFMSINTWQPRSPSPKIHSPSVTTMTWIFLSSQFFDALRILPLKNPFFAKYSIIV